MTASNLFESNDSVMSILKGAALDSLPSIDLNPLQRGVSLASKSSFRSNNDNNTADIFKDGALDSVLSIGLSPLQSMDGEATVNDNTASAAASALPERSNNNSPTSEAAATVARPTTVTRSASASKRFLQNMHAILTAKPASNEPAAAASQPLVLPPPRTRSNSGYKRNLDELTNSRTWNNLGTHEDIPVSDLANVFQTQPDTPALIDANVEVVEETETTTTTTFCEPRDNDVLLGRGGRSGNHPGNKKYLALKDAMQARYMTADKNEKKIISQQLVDIVNKEWKGRFLKLDAGRWYEIDNETARKKCSQALREINTPEVRAAKRRRYAK